MNYEDLGANILYEVERECPAPVEGVVAAFTAQGYPKDVVLAHLKMMFDHRYLGFFPSHNQEAANAPIRHVASGLAPTSAAPMIGLHVLAHELLRQVRKVEEDTGEPTDADALMSLFEDYGYPVWASELAIQNLFELERIFLYREHDHNEYDMCRFMQLTANPSNGMTLTELREEEAEGER